MTTLDADPLGRASAADRRAAGNGRRGGAPPAGGVARGWRLATVAMLVVGLLTAGLARQWAMGLQDAAARTGPYYSERSAKVGQKLAGMDSFTLGLVLGGLRGPLVMFLWVSSENQKNERDLEDFDTKVELIRMLQPEFVSVHLFQMWNKAYNISAQLASLPNKYSAILDALDYGRSVDAERPNDLNVQMAIHQLYSNKLGQTAGDKEYYLRQVREESKHRVRSSAARAGGTTRREHDPVLGPDGRILPHLLAGPRPRPGTLPAHVLLPRDMVPQLTAAAAQAGVTIAPSQVASASTGGARVTLPESDARRLEQVFYPEPARYIYADWNTGAELQYLEPYQPFPNGVSPLALGYNYAKRGQVLMTAGGQQPLQVSRGVVDSRPALELKAWSEEESERAIKAELTAFGVKENPPVRQLMELPTADLPLDRKPADPAAVQAAIEAYEMTARLARDAKAEYARHLENPENVINQFQDYSSHTDHLTAVQHLALADAAYLRAMGLPPGDARQAAIRSAAVNYSWTIHWFQYTDLRYYVPGEIAEPLYPRGKTRANLDEIRRDPAALEALYIRVMTAIANSGADDQNSDDRAEYAPYRLRAQRRLDLLAPLLGTQPAPAAPTGPATQPAGTSADAASPATRPADVGPAGPTP